MKYLCKILPSRIDLLLLFRDDEIKRCIEQNSYPPLARAGRYNEEKTIEQIKKVLKPGTRNHLKVFHLERDQNLTETIFRTIAEGIN